MNTMLSDDLKKAGATSGGEWAGPCPKCGGDDRFRVWPDHPSSETGRFWCRQCDWKGDGLDYVQELRGLTFREACQELNVTHKLGTAASSTSSARRRRKPARRRRPKPPKVVTPPGPVWQERALRIALRAHEVLYSDAGLQAYTYLREERGLSDVVICEAGLGYIPTEVRDDPGRWALHDRERPVYLPRGISIPWLAGGTEPRLWRLKVRRVPWDPGFDPDKDGKYAQPAGGADGLFCEAEVRAGEPLVLCEGELDCLSVWEALRGQYRAVAVGGASAGDLVQWRGRLATASVVLVAFDADKAGDKKAEVWMGKLPNAVRLRPTRHDVNEMLTAGDDLKAWIEGALSHGAQQRATGP